ncbi:MAG: SDR family NAD(P)-dependent oxidoreductase [Isosphaeraceae bacterium]
MTNDKNGYALVTGASSGLGRELVRQLVRDRGMRVLATARRLDRLESLAAEFPPGWVEILAGDLADPGFRQTLWDHALRLEGGVELLVNNAGLGNYAEFADQDPDQIRQMIELNLMALIDLSQKAARHMKAKRSGQILQISSVLGFVGVADSAVYVATKHAVNGLVKSLRYELAGTGVRIWAACPGRTMSEFSEVAGGNTGKAHTWPEREPTDRVVRGIVRGLDSRRGLVMPTWRAWTIVTLAHWLPIPFDWIMMRFKPARSQDRAEERRST